jgi:hypothetical protein
MAKTKTKAKDRDADREDREEREERSERADRPARPKPKNDVYVVMLLITFFAILVGCVMLYLDTDQYSGKSPQKEVIPALTDLGGGTASPKQ